MRIAITGGAGFIGSHVAGLCVERGHDVIVIDDLSVGRLGNVPTDIPFVHADIRDTAAVTTALTGCEVVCHLAARVSIRSAVARFVDDADVNVLGTLSVLEAARNAGTKRIIYASSMAVYGEPVRNPQTELHPIHPTSPYGVGKHAAEQYVQTLAPLWGMTSTILRYFNTYGPRQTPSPYVGVMTIFIQRCLQGQPLQIFGDGLQSRDFTYVGDIAEATLRVALSDRDGALANVGTGVGTSVKRIAELIIEATGAQVPIEHLPPAPGEARDSLADIAMLQTLCDGWSPATRVEDKLHEVIEWNREMQWLVEGDLAQP